MKHEKWLPIIKWTIYFFLLVLFYSLQTTPGLFQIFGVKPVLILPLAICVSMYEDVMPSAIFCMITGLLWDISSDKLFGFNGIILLCCGVLISLSCIYYLRTKLLNSIFFATIALLFQGFLSYLFYYAIWGYEKPQIILVNSILPTGLYTLLLTVPIFFFVRLIADRMSSVTRA